MAKQQIKNYVFKPGMSAVAYAYPNSYGLLYSNKKYLQVEATAWITQQVAHGAQYTPTTATYTPATGIMELTIGAHSLEVGDVLGLNAAGITFTRASDSSSHAYPRATGAPTTSGSDPSYNNPVFITAVTATTITILVGISSDTSVHTFASATSNVVTAGFAGYTFNESKCQRDLKYVLDAYLWDLRYGGNEETRFVASKYFEGTVAQVDGDRLPEIYTHTKIRNLIKDFIFTKTINPNAVNTTVAQNITGNASEAMAQFTPTDGTYTPTTGVMSLTIGTHTLTVGSEIHIAPASITFTCALDGNATLHPYPRASGVPNTTGKDPFYYAPVRITAVTGTTVSFNIGVSSDTSLHTFNSALTNGVTAGPAAVINTLAFNVIDTITTGLTSLPTLVESGVGNIKVQGRHGLEALLLITNTTKNEIVYNFASNETGGKTKLITKGYDEDFKTYLQTTDAITKIWFNYDTSSHAITDEIQVFAETAEVKIRPYDFGTDAIERMRIANPLSMLDADFEYGLQPTKWSAIGTLRGYPSVYEIPATNTAVLSVTTDASAGTAGIGASLITVTTVVAHGFQAGDPVTIKALENSIAGVARAEGSFVINLIPTANSFNYYAKSKVGTSSGQILTTTYAQLRKAAFYTGASIGQPIISVASNGSSGSFTTQLAVLQGSTTIPFDGAAPEIGSPLTNASIPTGAQVTSIIDTSAGGGTFLTLETTTTTAANTDTLQVSDTTGLQNDMAVDRGDGTAIYVQSIGTGGDALGVQFSANFINPRIGNIVSYSALAGINVSAIGENATFNISPSADSSNLYILDSIATGGNNYEVGDSIKILGNLLGGESPANDAVIYVTSIASDGDINSATITGLSFNGFATLGGAVHTPYGYLGGGAVFNVSYLNTTYTGVTIANGGTSYKVGDVIVIDGSVIQPSGGSSVHTNYVTVSTVAAGGEVLAINNITQVPANRIPGTYTGVASTGGGGSTYTVIVSPAGEHLTMTNFSAADALRPQLTYSGVTGTSSGSGTVGTFNITVNAIGAILDVTVVTKGSGHTAGDTITIADAVLGAGGAPNFTMDISTISVAGDVTMNAITIVTAGTGVAQGATITIADAVLGGGGGADITFEAQTVGLSGRITGITFSTINAPQRDETFTNVAYTTDSSGGSGATFAIQVTGASYQVTGGGGTNYLVGDIITFAGDQIGGSDPANNAVATVTTVDAGGAVLAYTVTGAAVNGRTATGMTGANRQGSAATFSIELSEGDYTFIGVGTPGTGYGLGQQLIVPGSNLRGASPVNDATVTITSIDQVSTGAITGVTVTGTAANPTGPYNSLTGANISNTGVDATFNVRRNYTAYDNISVTGGGTGYKIGDRITILGTSLEGASPLNDIELFVDAVGGNIITAVTGTYTIAVPGTNIDVISTVSISEPTSAPILINQTVSYAALATLNIGWAYAHGLVPGDTFIVAVTSDDGSNNHALAGGSFFATEIPTINGIRYQARAVGAIDVSSIPLNGVVYPRPDSFFVHRPYDGGVQLGTGGPQHGAQAIRQSKKYIRYQSGKGIMYTTGALFAPSYDLQSVVAENVEVGALITITCDDNDHGVQEGGVIRLLGIETEGYNSGNETAVGSNFDYDVVDVVDERIFKVRSKRRLGATTAVLGFGAQMSVVSWHGATVRSGIFDDQNGIFWEFDGTQISAVQRTGTKQVAGTIALEVDSNYITGTNTRFRDQLKAGDRVILKGMTHVVSHVISDTTMTVTPDWRGVINITGAKMALVADKKAKQSEFNVDKLDGTGPSGYDMDIAKMQMIGIQYTWYGAGFIDWMVRGSTGAFVFAHRMRNSNVNTEAFMRSGNLPVRYEVTNEGPPGKLKSAMTNSQTTMVLEDSSFFPYAATLYVDNEIITYTANNTTTNTLSGLNRGAALSTFQAGAQRSYTAGPAIVHDARTGVVIISQTITPLISHWGSAFLTDGGFDEDRGYIFSYAETSIAVSTTKQTAFMMRLAPSVSNAIVGDLGERELLNRAQLLLMGLEVTSDSGTGGIVIEGVLNPQNYPLNPSDVGWSQLSGVAQGGQPSFAQVASGGGVTWTTGVSAVNSTITSVDTIGATINSGQYGSSSNRRYLYISATDFRAVFGNSNMSEVVGKTITGTGIASNTTIQSGYIRTYDNYGYFRLSKNLTQTINANTADAITVAYNTALVNKSYGYFTSASVSATTASIGTAITAINGGGTFPANTQISNIASITWAGNTFFQIDFNNSFTGTLALNTGTITATVEQPPFAQPGETVFSFIAVPGERSTLDLTQLKELTNTPLGGRGTFPNGPDVLAINVYKVDGADINSNIIIKWGEAQA